MLNLSIDLETFSSVPIAKAGMYKYVQSPDFEILLMAYSIGGEPEIIDLAQGEIIPQWLYDAIRSPDYIKHAYNAAFEWYCLSKFYGELLPVNQWRDTMLHGLYCGFTAGLDATGKALGLPAEKQKLAVGKSLIRYFCVPTNQQRRNLPKHDPAKWELFKTYCKGDVTTEMEIERRLSGFPVPDDIEKQWQTDLVINTRGVAVDMDFVHGALDVGNNTRERLMQEAVKISGLENPNSVAQLSKWLETETDESIPNLRKETVSALLDSQTVTGKAERMLEIRQELGKTSIKKYDAIEACVCSDGRVRGLLQFYGANRSGRWCLTGDHEVLTLDNGWVRLDSWSGGVIACWHPYGETISFQNAECVSFNYTGLVYEYNDKRISQISTPDHKMYVKRIYRGEWLTDSVENMQAYRPSIPFTGWRRYISGQEYDNLRVLVMVQADGHYTSDGSVRFAFKKKRKIERCKMLLRHAGIPFLKFEYSDRTVIAIPERSVPLWLRLFKNKTFGTWLFDENPDIFFDELVYWDGYHSTKNSIQYCTCNKENADLVQAFAHLSGRSALMKVKRRSEKHENWRDAYYLDIWQNPGNCHEIRSKASTYNYSGKVYCAVTQTGYFIVRRNGRVWVTGNSGRLIQIQNLPRTYIEQLDVARAAVKQRKAETLKFCFGSVNDTLSQLIRTSFIAAKGNKLIDADFSSIEARVISWLAKEGWRLEVFHTGGDIYCMAASNMFGVPVEKHGANAELRQKGKVAELACIAEGQLVLTDKGLVPIENITLNHRLWDGLEWVTHDGLIYRGEKEVIEYAGLTATPDHLVYIKGQSRPVRFDFAASSGAYLVQSGSQKLARDCYTAKVYDIRNAGSRHRFTVSGCLVHNCGYGGGAGALIAMGALKMGIPEEDLPDIVSRWRNANRRIVEFWYDVENAAVSVIKTGKQEIINGLVFSREFDLNNKLEFMTIRLPSGRKLYYAHPKLGVNQWGNPSINYFGVNQTTKQWTRIETYGAKIVENIVQAIARDCLAVAIERLEEAGFPVVFHVHDEVVIDCPEARANLDRVIEFMTQPISWALDLPLNADGWVGEFFKKD